VNTIVVAHDSFAEIAEEWEELADRVGASPFVRPGWFAAWFDAFGDGEPTVLAVRDGERLAGVLPLVARRRRLRSPTNTHTPVFDLVAEDAETARVLAGELLGRRFHQLDLAYLDPGGPLFKAFSGAAGAPGRGPRILSTVLMRSPYVPLHGDFEAFRAGLPRNFRRQLDRRRRRLGELGELTFEFSDGGDDLDGLLDVGFELEASGWKVGEGTAIRSSERRIRFYRALAEWARSHGWLTLAFARLDGRPIAFDLCIEQGGRTYALKGGYDPEFAKYGASFLLIEETIARGYAAGGESYELLGDADDYKLQITDTVRERMVLQAFSRGPAGFARYLGYARVRPAVKRGGR
jgi:CelD/BcsL family acetyltransferase involved in cellulose biosynthesis